MFESIKAWWAGVRGKLDVAKEKIADEKVEKYLAADNTDNTADMPIEPAAVVVYDPVHVPTVKKPRKPSVSKPAAKPASKPMAKPAVKNAPNKPAVQKTKPAVHKSPAKPTPAKTQTKK